METNMLQEQESTVHTRESLFATLERQSLIARATCGVLKATSARFNPLPVIERL